MQRPPPCPPHRSDRWLCIPQMAARCGGGGFLHDVFDRDTTAHMALGGSAPRAPPCVATGEIDDSRPAHRSGTHPRRQNQVCVAVPRLPRGPGRGHSAKALRDAAAQPQAHAPVTRDLDASPTATDMTAPPSLGAPDLASRAASELGCFVSFPETREPTLLTSVGAPPPTMAVSVDQPQRCVQVTRGARPAPFHPCAIQPAGRGWWDMPDPLGSLEAQRGTLPHATYTALSDIDSRPQRFGPAPESSSDNGKPHRPAPQRPIAAELVHIRYVSTCCGAFAPVAAAATYVGGADAGWPALSTRPPREPDIRLGSLALEMDAAALATVIHTLAPAISIECVAVFGRHYGCGAVWVAPPQCQQHDLRPPDNFDYFGAHVTDAVSRLNRRAWLGPGHAICAPWHGPAPVPPAPPLTRGDGPWVVSRIDAALDPGLDALHAHLRALFPADLNMERIKAPRHLMSADFWVAG